MADTVNGQKQSFDEDVSIGRDQFCHGAPRKKLKVFRRIGFKPQAVLQQIFPQVIFSVDINHVLISARFYRTILLFRFIRKRQRSSPLENYVAGRRQSRN